MHYNYIKHVTERLSGKLHGVFLVEFKGYKQISFTKIS